MYPLSSSHLPSNIVTLITSVLVIDKKGNTVLYLRLNKALYGIMQASKLFYLNMVKYLKTIGFILNPYDPCVANKMVNGNQLTLIWHVEDFKLSHVDLAVVDDHICLFRQQYHSKIESAPMSVQRGPILEFLGLTLDFSVTGKLSVSMQAYVNNILTQFPDPKKEKQAATPACTHLFKIDEKAVNLEPKKARIFHHYVAKLLYLAKRVRHDIGLAVAFLTTRIREPDIDDWKKLTRTIRYLQGTSNMKLTLEASQIPVSKWWIDASHAVHSTCRSHMGAAVTIGKGAIMSYSRKQRINTRSSTVSELVAVDDIFPHVLWTRIFLSSQDYQTCASIAYQDNRSAILLEENGRWSAGRNTKHLNVRYFFIKDHCDRGEINIEWCPTDDMLGDFFTKPLQGTSFDKFRRMIMNLPY